MAKQALPLLGTKEKDGISVNLHDFGQGIFESYQTQTIGAAQKAFFQFSQNGQGVQATSVIRGETVRTAIRLGIASGIPLADVDTMKPYLVEWLADVIKKHVSDVVAAPADPNL